MSGVVDPGLRPAPGKGKDGVIFQWGGIFNTRFWVDSKNEVIGVVLTQLFPNGHTAKTMDEFIKKTYEAVLE